MWPKFPCARADGSLNFRDQSVANANVNKHDHCRLFSFTRLLKRTDRDVSTHINFADGPANCVRSQINPITKDAKISLARSLDRPVFSAIWEKIHSQKLVKAATSPSKQSNRPFGGLRGLYVWGQAALLDSRQREKCIFAPWRFIYLGQAGLCWAANSPLDFCPEIKRHECIE